MNYLLIGLGGGLGAVCRFVLGGYISSLFPVGLRFPVGTLVVNILGSLLIGFFIGLTSNGLIAGVSANNMIFFSIIGFCGGFTTFSTFSLDIVLMLKSGDYFMATLYVLMSLLMCVVATVAGFYMKNCFKF